MATQPVGGIWGPEIDLIDLQAIALELSQPGAVSADGGDLSVAKGRSEMSAYETGRSCH